MKIDKNQCDEFHELLNIRTKSELYFDKYNHTMSFFRTIFGLVNVLLSTIIACKVFDLV